MKTALINLLFLIASMIIFTSCSKKNFDQQPTTPPLKDGGITYGIDITLDSISQSVTSLISNTIDTSEKRMNYYYYYMSVSLQQLFENQSFNEYVISLAQQNDAHIADLTTIYNGSIAYKNIIDDVLDDFDITFEEIVDNYTYNQGTTHESYIPAIFVPNADIADAGKQPIFSADIEADCSNDPDLEDCIIVWYFDNGVRKQALLTEAQSLETTNPIFLLDNAEEGMFELKNCAAPEPDDNLKSTETTTHFYSYEYRVNQNYEPWPGRTEFTITAYRISPTGGIYWIYNSGGWMEINKVQRSEIGHDLTKWVLHSYNYTPYTTNYVYWNTFEKDWNHSPKPLGNATENGVTVHLTGNMHHNGDWYGWDPANLQDHNTDCAYIYSNWAKMYDNSKGKYKIWRVEL